VKLFLLCLKHLFAYLVIGSGCAGNKYLIGVEKMKIDFKVLVVLVLVLAISIWTINLLRPRNYTGDHLSFEVGSGTVTVTNPADTGTAAQVVGTGSRFFDISSNIAGVSGRSTREGSGRTSTQVFAFELPSGESEFSIEKGVDVVFSAATDTQLTVTVMPLSASGTRNAIIALLVAIVGSLYYISSTMSHSWIGKLRGEVPAVIPPLPLNLNKGGGHGQPIKSFGDNISRKSD
jgi:hypothetical protein